MLTLATFTELKSMLSLEKDSIDDYPSLKLIVSSVYAALESYTGRTFELDTYVETLDVTGTQVPLKALPVVSVDSLVDNDLGVTYTAGSWRIREHGLAANFRLSGRVTVTYTGGMEDAPAELKRAATLQILHEWARRDSVGATSVSTDGGSTSWPELSLLKEVRRLLDPFVVPAKVW